MRFSFGCTFSATWLGYRRWVWKPMIKPSALRTVFSIHQGYDIRWLRADIQVYGPGRAYPRKVA